MNMDKYGNYVRKFIWQLCRWDKVDHGLLDRKRQSLLYTG
jgi:hypothetical protein